MQLDEFTSARSFLKVTCTKQGDLQDQDFFRVDQSITHWPHEEVEFQYLMENIRLRQERNSLNREINIKKVSLQIRNNESRFECDMAYNKWLHQSGETERFMSQDIQRWRNQDFACTVYQKGNHEQGTTYWIEAVHVDSYKERAIKFVSSMGGMRGEILKYYIDSMLAIYESK